jgi:DNA helicase-2/ATP-dependent DNA helicase PcrA
MPLSPSKGGNRLIVAAAGSGKTSHIVKEAIARNDGGVLVTTFTEANEAEIRSRFVEVVGCVPAHVTVQTWYSFLIEHGARPYQGAAPSPDIKGLIIPAGRSAQGIAETDTARHYFTSDHKIYSDKLAKFAIKCDGAANGAVIERLSRVFRHIFIDEVQDFSGHDLDFIRLLLQSSIQMTLVGDPRQSVYATSNAAKNRKYKGEQVLGFFEDQSIEIEKNVDSLTVNHRSVEEICVLSNQLFLHLPAVKSGQTRKTSHDGVYLLALEHVDAYLQEFGAIQLRYRSDSKHVRQELPAYNFGLSKGMQFDRVLIFPTEQMEEWLTASDSELAPATRAKFYVALTRARFSVAIVTAKDCGGRLPKYVPASSTPTDN